MPRGTTIRVYQDAIAGLADDPTDPVTDILDAIAEEVRQRALENARVIVPNLPEDFISIETGKDTRGLFFRVLPDGGGRLSNYLIFKEFREHNWLAPAVEEVVGSGSIRSAENRSISAFRSNIGEFFGA